MPKEKRIKKLIERVLGGDKEAKEDLILDLDTRYAEKTLEELKGMHAKENSPEELKKSLTEMRDALYKKIMEEKEDL